MSKVQVQGNASGTGVLTIAAPNTNSNRTITLPDADGTVQLSGNPISGTTGTFSGDVTLLGGTANGVLYLNGSKVQTSGIDLQFDGVNLGIGMTPTYKLDITSGNTFSARFQGSEGPPFVIRHLAPAVYIASDISLYESIGFDPTNHVVNFYTNNAERARIDSSGNLGIGVAPSSWWSSLKGVQAYGASGGVFASASPNGHFITNAYYDGSNWKYISTSSYPASRYVQTSGGTHEWYISSAGTAGNNISFTQAMTINADQSIMFNKTTLNAAIVGTEIRPDGQIYVTNAGNASNKSALHVYSTLAGTYRFFVDMAGTIYATSTSISAISDARFKENIRDLDAGLDAVMQLRPRLFDWKEGKGANVKNARGFIAQEFEEVFPDLIGVWKDPAPEGEEPYKSVRQDLMPVLVKAIQEQQAIIESLKARLDAAGL